jgi:hypothetical protein
MNVMKLLPMFDSIKDHVEKVKRPLRTPPKIKVSRVITPRQVTELERQHRASAFARYQLKNPLKKLYFEQMAKEKNLSNAHVAAVTAWLDEYKKRERLYGDSVV